MHNYCRQKANRNCLDKGAYLVIITPEIQTKLYKTTKKKKLYFCLFDALTIH